MSSVAEYELALTDEQIDELLKIPEIQTAIDEYTSIQRKFRARLLHSVRVAPGGGLPDVSDISDQMDRELEGQRETVQRLVRQHVRQLWMLR